MKNFIRKLLLFVTTAVILYVYYSMTLEARGFENTVISMLSIIIAYAWVIAFKVMD